MDAGKIYWTMIKSVYTLFPYSFVGYSFMFLFRNANETSLGQIYHTPSLETMIRFFNSKFASHGYGT